ncbi:MAG: hypothetical protein ABIH92_00465 [Nanoarchaeota archaeon]
MVENYAIGNRKLRARTNTIIATTNAITWPGETMKREENSSSYRINPPKTPGM